LTAGKRAPALSLREKPPQPHDLRNLVHILQ
jgi:hypothetical protein